MRWHHARRGLEVAKLVEATGQRRLHQHLDRGGHRDPVHDRGSMHIPPGYALFIPAALREHVSCRWSVSAASRTRSRPIGRCEEGHCDLVGVVRGQIADPDFAAKARAGHADEIRLCLSCNQECVGRMGLNRWLGCIENPATGREAIVSEPSSRCAGPAGARRRCRSRRAAVRHLRCPARARGRGRARPEPGAGGNRAAGRVGAQPRRVRRPRSATSSSNARDLASTSASTRAPMPSSCEREAPTPSSWPRAQRPRRPTGCRGDQPTGIRFADCHRGPRWHGRPQGRSSSSTSSASTRPQRGRATRRARLRGRGHHAGHGRRPGSRRHARHGGLAYARGMPRASCIDHRHSSTGVEGGDAAADAPPHRRDALEAVDWLVLAVHRRARRRALPRVRDAGMTVHRVGDAVAPRRAHAAVIDGQRVGGKLGRTPAAVMARCGRPAAVPGARGRARSVDREPSRRRRGGRCR